MGWSGKITAEIAILTDAEGLPDFSKFPPHMGGDAI
jgi:hypothetical protein